MLMACNLLKLIGRYIFSVVILPLFVVSGNAEVLQQSYHLKWTEEGSFGTKTLSEMGTPEGQAIMRAICAAAGTDCSGPAALAGAYRYLTRLSGNQHWDNIMSPKGWSVCDLVYSGGVSSESSLSITWRHDDRVNFKGPDGNGPDGISLYFAVPQNEQRGHWIDTIIDIIYVPYSERDDHDCLPLSKSKPRTDLVVYACKGASGHPTMPRGLKDCK
jgi:hypothetical protein